jgi:hypothetical protein
MSIADGGAIASSKTIATTALVVTSTSALGAIVPLARLVMYVALRWMGAVW